MAIAEWSGMVWEVKPGCLRPFKTLSGNRSVKVERNEDKEGEPATQTVALELMTLSVEYDEVVMATGHDPRDRYGAWWRLVGTYAPFYLNGRPFMADLFMLKSANFSDLTADADGNVLKLTIQLEFEEYAEDASGLKTQDTAYQLSPGIYEQTATSAVDVGPTDAQKAGKMPANPGM